MAGSKDEGGCEEERPKLRGMANLTMLKGKKNNNSNQTFKAAVSD